MQALQWEPKLIQFQHILTKNDYLSKSPLPGYIDGIIFKFLQENKKYPDKKSYPHLYHWYVIIKQFSINSINKWITDRIYQDDNCENLIKIFSDVVKINKIIAQKKQKKVQFPLCEQKSNNLKHIHSKISTNIQKQIPNPQIINFSFNKDCKVQNYSLVMYLKTIQNLENFSDKLYNLKIKIKQLQYDKSEKKVFLRFRSDKFNCNEIKNQITTWNEVKSIDCKKLTTKPRLSNSSSQRSSLTKTTNYRS